jgi:long-chain acyl-CoA synthetase
MTFANFWTRAEADPAHIAIIDPSHRQVSAGELLASVNQVVHGLRTLGLQPGDSIAAMLPNSIEAFELQLAIQQAGWYMTPINYHLVGPEIAYIVNDCEAKAFIAHARFAEPVAQAAPELNLPTAGRFAVGGIPGFRTYDELKAAMPTSTPVQRMAGRMMMYTSGTTGRPKGVRRPLPGGSPEEFGGFSTGLQHYRIEPATDHIHLLACPWYHTAPNVMASASLHLGHTLLEMDKWDAELALELIQRYRVTISHLVPTQFARLVVLPDEVKSRYDLTSLRNIVHGAAPCPPEVKRRMLEWWGPIIYEYYSSTEGGGTVGYPEDWLARPGTVGKPWHGAEIVILDDDGQPLPPGSVGTVCFLGSSGPFEYFKDPEKSSQARRGRYTTVGDIGYFDDDGFLFLCDRKADIIVSGGVNIYPAEIEAVLITHPRVVDVGVFGVPNAEWGEEVKAVVEIASSDADMAGLADELLSFCDGKLARFKLPKSIEFTNQLPRDPSGKLYRRKLREPYWAAQAKSI